MKGKTIAKVIVYVLVILLLVGVVGTIYKFTNGFNEDFKTFYLEYDGKQILTTDSKMDLARASTHKFDVKYTFDTDKSELKDYSVKIVTNVTKDFDYTVDGERYLFSKLVDITKGFNIRKEERSFEIILPDVCDFRTVMQEYYKGKTLVLPESAEADNPRPFKLIVASYNGKVKYNILFDIVEGPVKEIELNPSNIIFGGNGIITDNDNTGGNSGTTTERTYNITYTAVGENVGVYVNPPEGESTVNYVVVNTNKTKAKAGETVTMNIWLNFMVGMGDYYVSGVQYLSGSTHKNCLASNGNYSFTMPDGDTTVKIILEIQERDDMYPIAPYFGTFRYSDTSQTVTSSATSFAVAGVDTGCIFRAKNITEDIVWHTRTFSKNNVLCAYDVILNGNAVALYFYDEPSDCWYRFVNGNIALVCFERV